MNIENITRLADAVLASTVFDMEDHKTCLCGVAARLEGKTPGALTYDGGRLMAFLGMDRPASGRSDDYERWNDMRNAIVCAIGSGSFTSLAQITREDAAAMLLRLAETGEVRW